MMGMNACHAQGNKYYVYQHKDLETGELVYVGHGTNGRAWDCSGKSRDKPHKEWMLNQYLISPFFVDILFITSDKAECLKYEKELIYKYKPRFNNLLNGSRNPSAKLNEEQVLEIINLLHQGLSAKEVASQFNLERTQVSNIKLGKRWSHITGIQYVPTRIQ
jgi:hypothetical protein